MMIKYVGEREIDLIPDKFYKAKKIRDDLGEGYAIYDEGENWYRYGKKFVEKNFEIKTFDEEIKFAVAV